MGARGRAITHEEIARFDRAEGAKVVLALNRALLCTEETRGEGSTDEAVALFKKLYHANSDPRAKALMIQSWLKPGRSSRAQDGVRAFLLQKLSSRELEEMKIELTSFMGPLWYRKSAGTTRELQAQSRAWCATLAPILRERVVRFELKKPRLDDVARRHSWMAIRALLVHDCGDLSREVWSKVGALDKKHVAVEEVFTEALVRAQAAPKKEVVGGASKPVEETSEASDAATFKALAKLRAAATMERLNNAYLYGEGGVELPPVSLPLRNIYQTRRVFFQQSARLLLLYVDSAFHVLFGDPKRGVAMLSDLFGAERSCTLVRGALERLSAPKHNFWRADATLSKSLRGAINKNILAHAERCPRSFMETSGGGDFGVQAGRMEGRLRHAAPGGSLTPLPDPMFR